MANIGRNAVYQHVAFQELLYSVDLTHVLGYRHGVYLAYLK